MSRLADLFTLLCVGAGLGFFMVGTVGLLRLPDTLSRIHALAKADNPGLGFIVLGLLPQAGGVLEGAKMVAVWLLAQLASGAVAQVMARAALEGTALEGTAPGDGAGGAAATGTASAAVPGARAAGAGGRAAP
ncbi:cation:proton antiporter [Xanthobacter sp. AM11]|uniref:cation:proton antiporter n=1 Tax=Xanthobacter sp. AM11 TaxID=3380643 RepID=UPI0039BF93D9